MADVAPNYEERQEFWKPAGFPRSESEPAEGSEHACRQCGGDLVVGSQFCHICGADRRPVFSGSFGLRWPSWRDLASIRELLSQSAAALAALALGFACLAAALLTGFIFTATTILDWQAVQLWRIEWLLAAIAFFVAGILLKKTRT